MSELVSYAGTVVMGFFAIMNPLANTPVFLGLTADDDVATRKAVARKSLLLAFAIVAVFTLTDISFSRCSASRCTPSG